ncbi:hypothetical protein like AT5G21130 [Hibiscus trionum]|uniref:Late embryogenesis abundant protein LEA-2 subgroup domain-containing protein n=1 Tax=Hibiscus trionum TaxID=183268 RepID=A0A9W7JE98_HIBTR|nr:hypothetical protein like AT5G21130 [Hibiscus trionum]
MGSQYPPNYMHQYPPQPYYGQPYYGQPPPADYYQSHPRNKAKSPGSSCCLRCICCCYNCLLFLIIASFVMSIFFLIYYQPERPIYELRDFAVKRFNINGSNLETEIAVSVMAYNTNSKLELSYGEDNSIEVEYSGTHLCSGSFPPFEQPRKNTTMVNVLLKGEDEVSQSFLDSLERDQKLGRIPLEIEIEVPVKFTHAGIKWRKMDAKMKCTVIIDSLRPDLETKVFYKVCGVKLEMS